MIVVVMMMMMMVPVAPDDDGPVVMVMMVVMGLCELHASFRRCGRRAFIDHLQHRCGVGNGLQQLGVGIGLQDVRRLGRRGRRSLGGA